MHRIRMSGDIARSMRDVDELMPCHIETQIARNSIVSRGEVRSHESFTEITSPDSQGLQSFSNSIARSGIRIILSGVVDAFWSFNLQRVVA